MDKQLGLEEVEDIPPSSGLIIDYQNQTETNQLARFAEKQITRHELEEIEKLTTTITTLITDTISTAKQQEIWLEKLATANNQSLNALLQLQTKLESWIQAKEEYLNLFEDSEVWREETIAKYSAWLESLSPSRIKFHQKIWYRTQYQPRRRLVDEYQMFPEQIRELEIFADFYELPFEKRQKKLAEMKRLLDQSFEKSLLSSQFNKEQKKQLITNFHQSSLEEKIEIFEALPEKISIRNKQTTQIETFHHKFPHHFNEEKQTELLNDEEKLSNFTENINSLSYEISELDFLRKQSIISEAQSMEMAESLIEIAQEFDKSQFQIHSLEIRNEIKNTIIENQIFAQQLQNSEMTNEEKETEISQFRNSTFKEKLELSANHANQPNLEPAQAQIAKSPRLKQELFAVSTMIQSLQLAKQAQIITGQFSQESREELAAKLENPDQDEEQIKLGEKISAIAQDEMIIDEEGEAAEVIEMNPNKFGKRKDETYRQSANEVREFLKSPDEINQEKSDLAFSAKILFMDEKGKEIPLKKAEALLQIRTENLAFAICESAANDNHQLDPATISQAIMDATISANFQLEAA